MNGFHWLWLGWLAIGIGIETLALISGRSGITLSAIIWAITKHYPLLPLVVGMIIGHFFWQQPIAPAHMASPAPGPPTANGAP